MEAQNLAILEAYEADVARWRERGGKYKDITPLTINDVLFIKHMLHPTKRKDSVEVTRTLINYLCEHKIATAKEIYVATGLSDKPVLKRLKIFQQFGLIRREQKKYYLATPRMMELHKRHLRRVCSI